MDVTFVIWCLATACDVTCPEKETNIHRQKDGNNTSKKDISTDGQTGRQAGRQTDRQRGERAREMRVALRPLRAAARKKQRGRAQLLLYPKLEHTFHSPRKPHNMWGANRPGGLTRPLCPGEEEEAQPLKPCESASSVLVS